MCHAHRPIKSVLSYPLSLDQGSTLTPPCSSDTDLVAAGFASILSLLLLLGVAAVPSKSPGISTSRIAPREKAC